MGLQDSLGRDVIDSEHKLTLHKYYCDICGQQLTVRIKSEHVFSARTGEPLYTVEYVCDKSRWYNRHTHWYYERHSYHDGRYQLNWIDLANSETDFWIDDLHYKGKG